MNPISILPPDKAHLPGLVALFEAQLQEHGIDSSPETLEAMLLTLNAQPEYGFLLSASHEGTPVGVAYAACILSLEHGGWGGWLEEFYVLPAWRGQGVGSSLLTAVIAAASERGWAASDLEVEADHQRVLSLYRRNGFEPVSRTRFVRRLA